MEWSVGYLKNGLMRSVTSKPNGGIVSASTALRHRLSATSIGLKTPQKVVFDTPGTHHHHLRGQEVNGTLGIN